MFHSLNNIDTCLCDLYISIWTVYFLNKLNSHLPIRCVVIWSNIRNIYSKDRDQVCTVQATTLLSSMKTPPVLTVFNISFAAATLSFLVLICHVRPVFLSPASLCSCCFHFNLETRINASIVSCFLRTVNLKPVL